MGFFSLFGKKCGKEEINEPNKDASNETAFTSEIYNYDQETIQSRATIAPIHPMIHARRSRQSMNGQPVDKEDLLCLFEAASFAPSGFNCQTWRFVYATRDSPLWNDYLDCLWQPNREWVKEAGALIVIVSKKSFKVAMGISMKNGDHSLDAGSAWMAMALEGTARGLVMHSINGFNSTNIAKVIKLADTNEYQIEAIIAVGCKSENVESDSDKITQRFDIQQIVSQGVLTKNA